MYTDTPGNCRFCGDSCEPANEPWTCMHCGVVYPPVPPPPRVAVTRAYDRHGSARYAPQDWLTVWVESESVACYPAEHGGRAHSLAAALRAAGSADECRDIVRRQLHRDRDI